MRWQKKVLIVEDDPLYSRFLVGYVESYGFTAIQAWSLAEAIKLVKEEEPDAVVIDVIIPEVSKPNSQIFLRGGLVLLKHIKEEYKHQQIKTIVITTTMPKRLRREFEEHGIDDIFVKPFAPEDLIKSLRSAQYVISKGGERK